MKVFIYILLCLFIFTNTVNAQEDETQTTQMYYLAEENVYDENFESALDLYLKLLEKYPMSIELNFKVGFCYLNIRDKAFMSVSYLQIAADKFQGQELETVSSVDLYYYLGRAYHLTGQFELAADNYKKAKKLLKPKDKAMFYIDKELDCCNNCLLLNRKPRNMQIKNAGTNINTEFPESSIFFSNSKIFFNSKRYTKSKKKGNTNLIATNRIYAAGNNKETFGPATEFDKFKDANAEIYICGLSGNGNEMLLNIDNDLYLSKLKDNTWTKPEKLTEINSQANEYYGCFNENGSRIYFSSDRKKGFGGKDIYYSVRQKDGSWSKPENAGTAVNTVYNEDYPFIYRDSILYFCSDGNKSMGGYDVFYSEINNNKLSPFLNMGSPVNSQNDELSFVRISDSTGFVSTYRKGSTGDLDIYRIRFYKEENKRIATAYGLLTTSDKQKLNDTRISIIDSFTMNTVNMFPCNRNTGEYSFVVPQNICYYMVFESSGYYFQTMELRANTNRYEVLEVDLNPINGEKSEQIYLLSFDDNVGRLSNLSQIILKRVADYLKPDNDFNIDITFLSYMNENEKFEGVKEEMLKVLLSKDINENRISTRAIIDPNIDVGIELRIYRKFVQKTDSLAIAYNTVNTNKNTKNTRETTKTDKSNSKQTDNNKNNQTNNITSKQNNNLAENKNDNTQNNISKTANNQNNIKNTEITNIITSQKVNTDQLIVESEGDTGAYTIQIAAYSRKLNVNFFSDLQNVRRFYGKDRLYRYTVGEFIDPNEALERLKQIRAMGYTQAFIRRTGFYAANR